MVLKNDSSSRLVICDIPAEFNSALNILVNNLTWCTVFLSMFISFLYMFRVDMGLSSGDTTIVYVLLGISPASEV